MPVVLVTGGSRGIGAATAELLASRGYDVCLSYQRDAEAAQRVVGRIHDIGRKALAVRSDVASDRDVRELFTACDEKLGRLSALINNAGILEKQTRCESITAERLNRVFAVNVTGAFLCAREAILRLSTKHGGQGGAIVNVSSAASRLGSPNEYVDYAASKGAVDAMTIGMAKELAPEGIRVNAVRPAFIYTDIHASGGEPGRVDRVAPNIPMRRGGTPDEVAQAIAWLVSESSSYVTGTFVDLAGGV